jgi:hypothetical protein
MRGDWADPRDVALPIALFQDWVGGSGMKDEAEAEFLVEGLEMLGINATVVFRSHTLTDISSMDKDVGMVFVDYGGVANGYGITEKLRPGWRAMQAWAREHPGTLVVIWTGFTTRLFRYEFDGEESEDNILLNPCMIGGPDEVPILRRIMAWAGVTHVELDDKGRRVFDT